jgi:hypothetical protein
MTDQPLSDLSAGQEPEAELPAGLVIVASTLPVQQLDAAVEHRSREAGLGRYQVLSLTELTACPYFIERVVARVAKAGIKAVLIIGRSHDGSPRDVAEGATVYAETVRDALLRQLPKGDVIVLISGMVTPPSSRSLPLVMSCGCYGDEKFVSSVIHAFGLHEQSFRSVTVPGGPGGMKRRNYKTQFAAEQMMSIIGSTSCVIVLGHVGCPDSGVSYAFNVEADAVELATGEAVTALYQAQAMDKPEARLRNIHSESVPAYNGIISLDGDRLKTRRPD